MNCNAVIFCDEMRLPDESAIGFFLQAELNLEIWLKDETSRLDLEESQVRPVGCPHSLQ